MKSNRPQVYTYTDRERERERERERKRERERERENSLQYWPYCDSEPCRVPDPGGALVVRGAEAPADLLVVQHRDLDLGLQAPQP